MIRVIRGDMAWETKRQIQRGKPRNHQFCFPVQLVVTAQMKAKLFCYKRFKKWNFPAARRLEYSLDSTSLEMGNSSLIATSWGAEDRESGASNILKCFEIFWIFWNFLIATSWGAGVREGGASMILKYFDIFWIFLNCLKCFKYF